MIVTAVLVALVAIGCGSTGGGDQAAQRPGPTTIAFLRAVPSGQPENQAAFLDELLDAGYVEGENLTVLAKDPAEVHPERADAEATSRAWQARGVDLIVALSTTGALSAAAAAPGTDVLFLVNDPVSAGLVDDPRRPEGRQTGVTFRIPPDRTLDLARRALPGVAAFGIVYPPSDPAAVAIKDQAVQAADDLGVPLSQAVFSNEQDAATAVNALAAGGVGAVWALNSPTTSRFTPAIEAAALAV
ncbi:MAG: ABC transporter substrate binding protein, partial [Acidimicrobiales bacterium]